MPKISVIVPIYKAEAYLDRCVESILSQTYTDFELILVDDGSPDRSGAICDAYAERDPRVRVIHKENGGVSSARNAGLDLAKGKYVAFIDSDDWISDNFLNDSVVTCEEKCLDIYMGGYNRVHASGEQSYHICISSVIDGSDRNLYEEEYIQLLQRSYIASSWGNLISRELIGQLRFRDKMNFGEDLTFIFALMKKNPRCYATPVPYYFYRDTDNSLIKQCNREKLLDGLQTYKVLFDFTESNHYSELFAYIQQRWINDLVGLQKTILCRHISLTKKYSLLSVLMSDRRLRNIIRQSDDPYCRRYCTYPARLICYHTYCKLRKKEGW